MVKQYMTAKRLERMKTHPYYCDICGQDFKTREEGKAHLMKYHLVRPFISIHIVPSKFNFLSMKKVA